MTRFITNKKGIYDNQEEKQYDFIAYDWIECDIEEVVGVLNNLQQEVIAQKSLANYYRQKYKECEKFVDDVKGEVVIKR